MVEDKEALDKGFVPLWDSSAVHIELARTPNN